jgi:16S rRNA (cytidine1402-2'-O)-methyltransferase
MPGTLSIVAVPIGNGDDLSPRALAVLRAAAVVACEDTRTTRALLAHHSATARTVAMHDHNEAERAPELVARLLAGDDVALVSEAGTPLVNDPGFRLVRSALDAGVAVTVVPGACAAVTALAGSGLPVDRWMYVGFFPRSEGERAALADELGALRATLIFYESPLRLGDTLDWLACTWPARAVCVARNLTKEHEQWIRGSAEQCRIALGDEIRGEVVLLVGPPRELPVASDPDALIRTLLDRGLDPRAVRDAAAEATGLSKRDLYRRVLLALGR